MRIRSRFVLGNPRDLRENPGRARNECGCCGLSRLLLVRHLSEFRSLPPIHHLRLDMVRCIKRHVVGARLSRHDHRHHIMRVGSHPRCDVRCLEYVFPGCLQKARSLSSPFCAVTVSFLWGVAYFQEDIRNWPWTLVGLSLLVVGVCGMCLSNLQVPVALPERLRILYRIVPCLAPPEGSYYAELDEMQSSRLLDADPEKPEPEPESQFRVRQFLLGIVVAVISGASYGTTMVPKVLSRDENATGLCYGFCFGMGVGVFTTLVVLFYFIISFLRGKGIPALHFRVVFLPAMIAGFVSNIGTVASIYATVNLGLTVGFPLTQMAVLVSGLWGLFLFKEMTRWNAISAFFLSGIILIGGAALLAVFAH